MVDETVDSILVKEGRVEITFLFYLLNIAMLFLSKHHDSTHIKNILRGNKNIQFLVLNTGSHVNGCVKMFILSFCQMSSSAKHKPEMLCSH